MMGTGENPGAVNYIVNAGWNAGRQALPVLHHNNRFNQALALGQKFDEFLVDNVNFLAKVGDTGLF